MCLILWQEFQMSMVGLRAMSLQMTQITFCVLLKVPKEHCIKDEPWHIDLRVKNDIKYFYQSGVSCL